MLEKLKENMLEERPEDFYRALESAEYIGEVKRLRDLAAAAQQYAKTARLGLDKQNIAAEAKIRAEYKAGQMLSQMPKMDGGDAKRKSLGLDFTMKASSYKEMGIEENEAVRWQRMARLQEAILNAYIQGVKDGRAELTSIGVLRLAKEKENVKMPWDKPHFNKGDSDVDGCWDDLAFATICNAIRDCTNRDYGDEPKEWILEGSFGNDPDGDCKSFFLKYELPYEMVCDWVKEGCDTKPLHERMIEILNKRYSNSKEIKRRHKLGRKFNFSGKV